MCRSIQIWYISDSDLSDGAYECGFVALIWINWMPCAFLESLHFFGFESKLNYSWQLFECEWICDFIFAFYSLIVAPSLTLRFVSCESLLDSFRFLYTELVWLSCFSSTCLNKLIMWMWAQAPDFITVEITNHIIIVLICHLETTNNNTTAHFTRDNELIAKIPYQSIWSSWRNRSRNRTNVFLLAPQNEAYFSTAKR